MIVVDLTGPGMILWSSDGCAVENAAIEFAVGHWYSEPIDMGDGDTPARFVPALAKNAVFESLQLFWHPECCIVYGDSSFVLTLGEWVELDGILEKLAEHILEVLNETGGSCE